MEKEFNLSEKIYDENYCPDSNTHWMRVKDIKEFIKRLKDETGSPEFNALIDKLAGPELIDNYDAEAHDDMIPHI